MADVGGIKITVSTQVAKGLKNKLKKEIVNSIEGDKAMRKEMQRVFQMANRRIQNIENGKVFSPAVQALGKGDIKGYSKFSVKGFGNTGSDWKHLVKEYTKAISFLNQPTSTARGARQFEQQVKQQMGISDDLWTAVRDNLLGGYNSVSSELLLALPYTDFIQNVYEQASQSASTQIEKDAKAEADALEKRIDEFAENTASAVEKAVNDMARMFVEGFKMDF